MASQPASVSETEKVEALKKKLEDAVRENGILDPISEVIVTGTGLTAENFGSTAGYATIKFKDEKKKPLHLFTKRHVESGVFSEMLNDWGLFEGEVEFFGKYYSLARKLCKSRGQEALLDMYPKCLHVDDKLIVLENLVLGNSYIMLNKVDQQDFEPAVLALINLAKHHAISHAVIKEYKGGHEAFFKDMPAMKDSYMKTPNIKTTMGPMFDSGLEGCRKIMERADVEGKDAIMERLRSLEGKAFDDTLEGFVIGSDEFTIICHGDYHNNNMMFKKSADGKFLDHKVIDLQTVWYGTPGNDIGHFLFSSVKSQVRQERIHELLQIYLDTLNDTTAALGHPAELSMQELLASFCKHFQYGYWLGMYLTQCGGWEIMKEFGEMTPEDMKDPAIMEEKVNTARERWMNQYPERCNEYGRSIVEYVREYDRLKKGREYELH